MMSMPTGEPRPVVDPKVEELARQIAIDHDLDPDDARLGHPAWRIGWILEEAEKRARAIGLPAAS